MSILKLNFNLKSLLVLLVVVATAVSVTSCNDDKDEPEAGANSLVGNWYYSEGGSLDDSDMLSFKSNGTVTYTDKYESVSVSGKYTYDAAAGNILFVWDDWPTELRSVRFLSENVIYIEAFGQYTRK